MDIVVMVIAAAILLGFLVFIHEGGHFLAARAFGVRVSEFMIGLPGPSIGVRLGETRFGLTVIPLGGYANICGMVAPSKGPHIKRVLGYVYAKGEAELETIAHDLCLTEDEAFDLLEELAEWGSITRPHKREDGEWYRTAATTELAEGTPRPVVNLNELYEREFSCQYCSLSFWKRCVILAAGPVANLLWVLLSFVVIYSVMGLDVTLESGEVTHYTWSPLDSITIGFNYLGAVVVAIAGLFNPSTAAETVSNSTSIVGIAVMSKSAIEAGFQNTLFFSAIISASLGLMNLLPIPPLDGGRLVIEIFQKLSSKQVSMRVLGYLSTVGMVLFLGFFLVMLNQDIQRFVFGNWS